ncbi:MAG TPA: VOC family protein [Caulobacteraceae bacterium]|nr:VOC family protein [Caulobacteraceae bacterium]
MLRLDHVNIRCADLDRSRAFYADALGLKEGARPTVGIPGAWLYLGDDPVVHLVDAKAMIVLETGSTGAIDHVAFQAGDFEATCARLERSGVPFQTNIFPDFGLKQLFILDPDGVKVELNFPERSGA